MTASSHGVAASHGVTAVTGDDLIVTLHALHAPVAGQVPDATSSTTAFAVFASAAGAFFNGHCPLLGHSVATGAGGRQPARQQGAVVSSPVPRSTPEARAIERAFAREITERLYREGVARLCRAERASGSERVCCALVCVLVGLFGARR